MSTTDIKLNDDHCQLRLLRPEDKDVLGALFDSLSAETRRRFAPHPLNAEHAADLCQQLQTPPRPERWLLLSENGNIGLGYFILDQQMSPHEQARFRAQGIELTSELDWLFAPVIADRYQAKGFASAVMPYLIAHARQAGARSLVLLGGTQSTNHQGIAFYRKFGFEQHGGYQTDIYNLDMRMQL